MKGTRDLILEKLNETKDMLEDDNYFSRFAGIVGIQRSSETLNGAVDHFLKYNGIPR
ncbi:hypothetical protein MYX84_15335 [Acidobacteria bacterium AH-259-O06]|nr:hypothetical protein [Acidobacteria bacterium AH-259-O06]